MQLNGARGGISITCHIISGWDGVSDRAALVQAKHKLLGREWALFEQFLSSFISGDQEACDNVFCHSSSLTLGDQTSQVYEMGSDPAYQAHNISV